MTTEAKTRILDAARAICREEGFRKLTMRRVADRLGVTAPSIYRHFRGKGELTAELLDEARETFARFLADVPRADTPEEMFRRGAAAYLRFALEKPRYYELLFLSPSQLGLPDSLDRFRSKPPPTFAVLQNLVAAGMQSGFLRDGDPTEVSVTIWGQCHGLISLYQAGRFGRDKRKFKKLFHQSIERILEGIKA